MTVIQRKKADRENGCGLVDIGNIGRGPFRRLLMKIFKYPIGKILCLDEINRAYNSVKDEMTCDNFFSKALETLGVTYSVSGEDIGKVPEKGPLVVVANHPFGGIEGIILADILTGIRRDVRILGNAFLRMIPELREWLIPVDVFGKKASVSENVESLRRAATWVRNGGVLLAFPSGEVSHFNFRRKRITDPEWSTHPGAIARKTEAKVLPVFIPGRNGLLFQTAGLLNSKLRTAFLVHELMNKADRHIEIRMGSPIRPECLRSMVNSREVTEYLRSITYLLRYRSGCSKALKRKERSREIQKVIYPVPKETLVREVAALPENGRLAGSREFEVYIAEADRIPGVMREIGRLREKTFREVGEGTGHSLDIDEYDSYYFHLFLWNRETSEVAGAYRLGCADRIMDRFGKKGLYTHSLFRFKDRCLYKFANGIELGRSFIRSEYQKKYGCLALLWKGIGGFAARNPRYSILFGPVSISRDYHAVSKNLMVRFLKQYRLNRDMSRWVSPRKPFRMRRLKGIELRSLLSSSDDIDDISPLISDIEKDGKGIPVLLKQYLRLNATIISFNVDTQFSNVIDGLIVVDLKKTEPRLLRRFMGKEGYERFLRVNSPQEFTEEPAAPV